MSRVVVTVEDMCDFSISLDTLSDIKMRAGGGVAKNCDPLEH
jgi:hypothetical protein